MALHVTQCPRCESTFNTSARLLEAAHGLVRCGACLSVFEADQHFVDTMAAASNDGTVGESVFISAPEDYFDATAFLQRDDQPEATAGTADSQDEELLYAKSDVQDSHFDVFEVDPEEHDSPVTEQVLDSDFDVFDVEDFEAADQEAQQDLQDNEFDIYDAGEREIRRPLFMLSDGAPDRSGDERHQERRTGSPTPAGSDDSEIQIRVSFSLDPEGSQVNFTSHPLPDNLWPGKTIAPAAARPAGSVPVEQEPEPGASTEPDSEPPVLSEVILPVGPDARTMLEALKKANEQSKKEQAKKEQEQEQEPDGDLGEDQHPDHQTDPDDAEFLYDDIELEPVEGKFLDAETVQPVTEDQPADDADDATIERSTASSEWEDIDADVDMSSFVILPEDPYQPSAFLIDNSEDMSSKRSEDQPAQTADAQQRKSDDGAAAVPQSSTNPEIENRVPEHEDDSKDQMRARVMSTELASDDEALERLSEENLRAVRDMDSSLELEQRRKRSGRKLALIACSCAFFSLAFTLVFFWQRMPELSQDPRFRPWYQSACDLAGCRLSPYVNPAEVLTDNLVVRSHPQLADTLELTAVFRNQAEFPQPFPLIELRFADLDDTTILARELRPDEYLPLALRGMPLMPVGAPVQITLELADPGPEAVNYRLDFKAAPPRPGS